MISHNYDSMISPEIAPRNLGKTMEHLVMTFPSTQLCDDRWEQHGKTISTEIGGK